MKNNQEKIRYTENNNVTDNHFFSGFLLAINDALLSPPAVKEDVGDQLCERVLGVLYEIWFVASF